MLTAQKVKVCCLCEQWASGGIESFLTNILVHMNFSQLEIDIVALAVDKSIFTSELNQHGIRIFELSGNRNNFVENRKMFIQIYKKRNYDVIHVNAFHGGLLYYLALARKMGIPVRIAHSHNTGLNRDGLYWFKVLIHRCSKLLWAKCVTDSWACSHEAAKFMFTKKTIQKGRFHIIQNGIDIDRFRFCEDGRASAREGLGITNQLLIGNIGRLSKQKNQKFLLYIFAELLKLNPNSRLILIGDGTLRAELEAKARLLQVDEKTFFCGTTSHVEQWLWAMDVFVFPSLFEGLGIAVIEAQAAGLPVICSNCVPNEAHILPSTQSLPLNCGAREWARVLANYQKSIGDREKCASCVRAAGFSRSEVARQIEATYLKSNRGHWDESGT